MFAAERRTRPPPVLPGSPAGGGATIADPSSGGFWFRTLLGTSFLMMTTVAAVKPMVSYRALELGAGSLEIGVIVSSFAILSVISAVPIGRRVDRIGEKPFILGGFVLVLASLLVSLTTASLVLLAASQALLGLGQITTTIGSQTLLANNEPASERAARFGNYSVVQSLGQLVGPVTAGLLAGYGATSVVGANGTVFVAGMLTAGLALAIAYAFLPAKGPRQHRADATVDPPGASSILAVLRLPRMGPALFASATVLVSVDLLLAYFPIYGTANGLSVQAVGLLLSIRAAASMFSRIFMGRLIRSKGQYTVLAGSLVVAAISMAAMGHVSSLAGLCLVMIVAGLGLGLGQPMTMSWVADNATADGRGIALAVRLTGNRLAQLLIPSLMGGLAAASGITGMFTVLGVVLGASALAVRVERRPRNRNPDR